MSIPVREQYHSIAQLESHLVRLESDEVGILSLDFDQTLVEGQPTLGDEHFYQFMMKKNREFGVKSGAHYHWTAKIRAKIPYSTCEPVERINAVIQKFREFGWHVKILTARLKDMRDATQLHLKQSKIALTIEDVIFMDYWPEEEGGHLMHKGECLFQWMQEEGHLEKKSRIRALHLDDSAKYCSDVAKVVHMVDRVAVSCFEYTGSAPSPDLTEHQLRRLVVQLHAHVEGKEINVDYTDEDLAKATKELKLDEINEGTVYQVIRWVAENDLLPIE